MKTFNEYFHDKIDCTDGTAIINEKRYNELMGQPPVWIAVKSGNLPKPNQPFWIWNESAKVRLIDGIDGKESVVDFFEIYTNATHWLSADQAPYSIPPAPVIDESEEAWEEYRKIPNQLCIGKATFITVFNLGKSKSK